jgi:hypothetical protein
MSFIVRSFVRKCDEVKEMSVSATPTIEKIPNLENLGNVVPEGYQYYEKLIRAGADLSLPTAYLKWYDIYPADAEITPEQNAETRAYLAAEVEKLKFEGDLGFVILHRSEHRGTFCVWELEAVWHERHAWVRFLSSERDEAAKLAYINDRYSRLT